MNKITRALQALTGCCLVLFLVAAGTPHAHASDDAYGEGNYGACTYDSCSITLSSSGTVDADITPSAGSTTCSVSDDSVSVLTDASTGYMLTFQDSDTNNHMVGANTSTLLPAVGGTRTSAVALTANTWGYRIDDSGALGTNFGAGPTTTQSNVAPGSLSVNKFAATPTSSPDELAATTTGADPAVIIKVWYGICADTSIPADSYSDAVTYTAVIN